MKKEKSCGAIIYKVEAGERSFLLIRSQRNNHYSYPKGHVENTETEVETALREIKEETNLDVILDQNFRKVNTYCPAFGVTKDVIYFVATPKPNQLIIPQPSEVAEAKWYSYQEAMKMITHDNDRKLLQEAVAYLQEKDK